MPSTINNRPLVRKLLEKLLACDADLEAFCLDSFPEVRFRVTSNMSRREKTTTLIEWVGEEKLLTALQNHFGPTDDNLSILQRALLILDGLDSSVPFQECKLNLQDNHRGISPRVILRAAGSFPCNSAEAVVERSNRPTALANPTASGPGSGNEVTPWEMKPNARTADRVFKMAEWILPKRITDEEFGDALEKICYQRLDVSKWTLGWLISITVFWAFVHAMKYGWQRAERSLRAIVSMALAPASSGQIGGNISSSAVCAGSHNAVNVRVTSTLNCTPSPEPIKILFLGAAPSDDVRLALSKEVREISRNLSESDKGRRFHLVEGWAICPTELQTILLQQRPHILHFSGHGSAAGELIFEDDQGKALLSSVVSVARLIATLSTGVRCVFLNACYSAAQAAAMQKHVDCVVGMTSAVSDASAIAFASCFYLALGHGQTVQTAFDLSCNQIESAGSYEADGPTLLCRPGLNAAAIVLAQSGVEGGGDRTEG